MEEIFLLTGILVLADGGSIENYGNIDLGDNILDISADSFTNQAGANVTANTVNLTVNSFVNGGINIDCISSLFLLLTLVHLIFKVISSFT